MTIRNLEHVLAPRSVAVIGASTEAGSVGNVLTENMLGGGFAGEVYLVNPHHESIGGRRCYRDVASLPATPELAVIATKPDTVPALIGELGKKGTRAVVVVTAGFSPALKQAMLDQAKPYCLRIIGPNCLGIAVPGIGLHANFGLNRPQAGKLAFLSQSGALITGILDWAVARGIGFSYVVSMGDMADVDVGDLLDFLAADIATQSILLYLETIPAARKFMSAARSAARAKPVIVIKSGRYRESARAAATHTGALAGSDAAVSAAFRRAGLVRVEELEELFAAAETLTSLKRVAGNELMILTNGGGAGVLAVDDLIQSGGRLAPLSDGAIAGPRQGAARQLVAGQSGRHHRRRGAQALRCRARCAASQAEGRRPARRQLPDRACLFERRGASRDRGDQARAERGAAAADPDQLARRGCGRGRTAPVPRGLDPDL